ncbi:hypothetical protein K474DRAFT_935281 [Panus rudis PR-1116 ss-1]|nr:hypothetical protein K474DRAFT_935281 [Panus rudis PR-1116 ss-1]
MGMFKLDASSSRSDIYASPGLAKSKRLSPTQSSSPQPINHGYCSAKSQTKHPGPHIELSPVLPHRDPTLSHLRNLRDFDGYNSVASIPHVICYPSGDIRQSSLHETVKGSSLEETLECVICASFPSISIQRSWWCCSLLRSLTWSSTNHVNFNTVWLHPRLFRAV